MFHVCNVRCDSICHLTYMYVFKYNCVCLYAYMILFCFYFLLLFLFLLLFFSFAGAVGRCAAGVTCSLRRDMHLLKVFWEKGRESEKKTAKTVPTTITTHLYLFIHNFNFKIARSHIFRWALRLISILFANL